MIGSRFGKAPYLIFASLALVLMPGSTIGQDVTAQDGGASAVEASKLAIAILQEVREENIEEALRLLGDASELTEKLSSSQDLAAAVGGVARFLHQLDTDEQYELLKTWSFPAGDRKAVRVLTSVVPEIGPPAGFARALGQRPRKDTFAVSSVGSMPGLFCSAWTMIAAADDAGSLSQLIIELEGLANSEVANADFVLTLAKLRDTRSDVEDLKTLLTRRVAGGDGVPAPANRSDAVLVAAGIQREELCGLCEQIVTRLNTFDFKQGSSTFVPWLRRLRAVTILKARSPETDPRELFYATPELWVSANDQRAAMRTSGADESVWLTHEDHVKRLAGPGDDQLLFRYPLVGKFELKGEVAELEHGGGGMTYGGLAFDANATAFTLTEVQRGHSVDRVWPFVAPPEHRMFNRVNLRSDGDQVVFLSNLHPGYTGTAVDCASSPWLGLRAFGDGRIIFRNLELVGEPIIPRQVNLIGAADLRGWTSTYGESTPKFVVPFPTRTDDTVAPDPVWYLTDGVIHGKASETPAADMVAQSHLAYIRPCLEDETLSYEFYHEDGKTTAHPTLGRLAFLIEAGGVRIHWLTAGATEWTGIPEDNAIVEPLNRRGPGALPLKNGEWNSVEMAFAAGKIMISLNGEEIYHRPVDDLVGRHFGIYHDRNNSAAQIRNVILKGDWPEKLSAEQQGNLVTFEAE